MARTKRSNLARTGVKNTTHQVAEFFHHVVAGLVSGTVATNGHQEFGDVYSDELALGVEVKSSDNRHPWRISIRQLKKHLRSMPFPLSSYLYAICSYRNNAWFKRGERKPRGFKAVTYSRLARYSHKHERHEFLAQHTDELYLLDIEIIRALARHYGTVEGSIPGGTGSALKLNRSIVRNFREDPRAFLDMLGLRSSRYIVESREVTLPVVVDDCQFVTRFTQISVIRKSLYKKLSTSQDTKTFVA